MILKQILNIKENISNIINDLDDKVQLVAVSKTKPTTSIYQDSVFLGKIKCKLVEKSINLAGNIQWHVIGHPPSTKEVNTSRRLLSLIHTIDSKS